MGTETGWGGRGFRNLAVMSHGQLAAMQALTLSQSACRAGVSFAAMMLSGRRNRVCGGLGCRVSLSRGVQALAYLQGPGGTGSPLGAVG